jgi:hypothetical protein
MKKITLILPAFVLLSTISVSCSKEADATNVKIFLNENNLEISRLTNDSSLYNTIQGRWKIAAERGKIGSFFFQTWNGLFMDFSADSIKIIQISEEKSFDFYTQSKDSICLSSYKMSFCAPNQLIFDNQTYSILKQEDQRIIIDSGNHGFLLER